VLSSPANKERTTLLYEQIERNDYGLAAERINSLSGQLNDRTTGRAD